MVKRHPGPGLRPSQHVPDLPEAEAPEGPEVHHLPGAGGQGMDLPQQVQMALPGEHVLLRGGARQAVLRQGLLRFSFPQVLVPQVLGDLAQPDGHLAGAVEPVDGPDGLVEGLLGQLLRQVGVMALGEEKFIDGPGMGLVNFFHVGQGHLPPLCQVCPAGGGFVTRI